MAWVRCLGGSVVPRAVGVRGSVCWLCREQAGYPTVAGFWWGWVRLDVEGGGVPAVLEVVEESYFDFGCDVGVDLGYAVGEVVPSRRAWAISGAPPAMSQVLWLCRSPWKVRPGLIGTVLTRA